MGSEVLCKMFWRRQKLSRLLTFLSEGVQHLKKDTLLQIGTYKNNQQILNTLSYSFKVRVVSWLCSLFCHLFWRAIGDKRWAEAPLCWPPPPPCSSTWSISSSFHFTAIFYLFLLKTGLSISCPHWCWSSDYFLLLRVTQIATHPAPAAAEICWIIDHAPLAKCLRKCFKSPIAFPCSNTSQHTNRKNNIWKLLWIVQSIKQSIITKWTRCTWRLFKPGIFFCFPFWYSNLNKHWVIEVALSVEVNRTKLILLIIFLIKNYYF